MKIGFVGDIHGRVLHTLAVLTRWQLHAQQKLDLIIQVGDLGAYPSPSEQLRNEKYVRQDPAELDFSRLVQAVGILAEDIRYIRDNHLNPIHFIRGNHEDFEWLGTINKQAEQGIASVDPFDMYRYVADGFILDAGPCRIAFLGGIESTESQPKSIDPVEYDKLRKCAPGEIDILITHDAPFGIGVNFLGNTQGSALITDLIETIQPRYLIAGHYHHMNGPRKYGNTTYLGLNVLVDLRDDGVRRRVQPGSIAVLETETDTLEYVTDDWLATMDKDFDFRTYMGKLRQQK